MQLWVTEIKAIDPKSGDLKIYGGPNVPGIDKAAAEAYCEQNGLGYCTVIGKLIAEIPTKGNNHKPDWENMIDYEKLNNN